MTSSLRQTESLPTITEIKSTSTYLKHKESYKDDRMVRVRDNMMVKFGQQEALLLEAETIQFLHTHIGAAVPRVFGTLVEDCAGEDDPAAKCYYIIMEYIAGKPYLEEVGSLAPAEKEDIRQQFRSIINKLRALPSPDSYECIGQRPLCGWVFAYPESEGPALRGPFATEEELNNGIALLMDRLVNKTFSHLLRECITDAFRGHRPVFTHGNLRPTNLIVSQVGKREDGHRLFKLTLINWTHAGWFPDYWDFCWAVSHGGQEWAELLHAGLDSYPRELPMMYLLIQTINSTY